LENSSRLLLTIACNASEKECKIPRKKSHCVSPNEEVKGFDLKPETVRNLSLNFTEFIFCESKLIKLKAKTNRSGLDEAGKLTQSIHNARNSDNLRWQVEIYFWIQIVFRNPIGDHGAQQIGLACANLPKLMNLQLDLSR